MTLNDNGDGDAGGNGLLNFPILSTADIAAGNLVLAGYARPGSVIELFVVAADPSGFGEGQTWKLTLTEGGTGAGGDDPYADTDAGTGTYGPGAINGLSQGTDTTNKFRFTFPVPAGVAAGTKLSATATIGGSTSEFSGNVTVAVGPADLALTKADNPDPAPAGGELLYTLVVTNNGPNHATNVVVTDTLPAGVTPDLGHAEPGELLGDGPGDLHARRDPQRRHGEHRDPRRDGRRRLDHEQRERDGDGDRSGPRQQRGERDDHGGQRRDDRHPADALPPDPRLRGLDGHGGNAAHPAEPPGGDACLVGASSTAALSGIPNSATVVGAYLYWAGSGSAVDSQVTLDAASLTADRTWTARYVLSGTNYDFFGGFEDVTAYVQANRNKNYTFGGLTVATGDQCCDIQAVLAGWALIVIYEDSSVSGKTLVLYDGFDITRNGSSSYVLSGIYASPPPEGRTRYLVWEGDESLSGATESLAFNGTNLSDALNPVNNVYNSTINTLGSSTSYGVDLDSFDVSSRIAARDTLATTTVNTGPDLVILNAVLLQVKSNIIVGTVFEDVNYGGGAGRNLATAVAGAPGFTRAAARRDGGAVRRRGRADPQHDDGCGRGVRVRGADRRGLHGAGGERQRDVVAARGGGDAAGGADVPDGREHRHRGGRDERGGRVEPEGPGRAGERDATRISGASSPSRGRLRRSSRGSR